MQVVHSFSVVAAPDYLGITDPKLVLDDTTRQLHPLVQTIQHQAVGHFPAAYIALAIQLAIEAGLQLQSGDFALKCLPEVAQQF
ncbi:hypothetical protein [Alkalimonas amylolytica]|uniref:hypothetical protein n=1 Tax=Alkalimonas amylolytica TaxID=152573 RepID=UPI001495589F|nr:hypothetical protein [Alkalimonas amylolytica]